MCYWRSDVWSHHLKAVWDITAPIVHRKQHNDLESRTLAALRDTLLPELLSGELRIPEAKEFLEAAL